MAPNSAAVSSVLYQTTYYHLDNMSYENALFFAERLQAHEGRTPESMFLLALCHFRLGDSRSAYDVSKHMVGRGGNLGGTLGGNVGCAFVFAQSCLELERYQDGIGALEKSRSLWTPDATIGKHGWCSRTPLPDASTLSCLLGKLYRGNDDTKKAISCFEDALRANPFMWDAFTILCDMGVSVRVPNIFKAGAGEALARNFDQESEGPEEQHAGALSIGLEPSQRKTQSQSHDPFDAPHPSTFQELPTSNVLLTESRDTDFMSKINAARRQYPPSQNGVVNDMTTTETPTGPGEVQTFRLGHTVEPPQAPIRRTRAAQAADSSLVEAPSGMSFRLGSRKRDKKGQEHGMDLSDSIARGSALAATERKRTASGHPVQSRPTNGEEPRRSARLNVFPKSTSRSNSGASAIGATGTRELKKARPPISRIMRPGSSGTTVGRVVSGNRKPMEENTMDVDDGPRAKGAPLVPPVPSRHAEPDPVKTEEALKWIIELLKKMASGYLLSSQFQCAEALNHYSSLPSRQLETPWVMAQMGKAHYEQTNYTEAERIFRRLRHMAPCRLEDMEVFSTVLWHLNKETDLSFLAHELIEEVWDSPQAWCALGNAWSLVRDHEQALKCFKRATQLDPKFAYAYTLQGHEHFLNEEYDKALTAYRHAASADRRHYNAYYGIGKVYEKLGNYEKAFTHYHTASVIHPTHAVLITCIGTVLEKQKQILLALKYFTQAADLAPTSAHTRFKKARALLATGQLQLAQRELMLLNNLAPDDARVHFLLGKLAKTLRDKATAIRHFTIALSLDPKASQQIKEEIESLDDDDILDDSMSQ